MEKRCPATGRGLLAKTKPQRHPKTKLKGLLAIINNIHLMKQ